MAPELTIYVSGFSKCLAPGLRLGFVVSSPPLIGQIARALRVNCWNTNPLTALIATILLEDGGTAKIIDAQKAELLRRQKLATDILQGFDFRADACGIYVWLNLPEPWRGADFARAAFQRGVGVIPGEAFAVIRGTAPDAVRINIGAARTKNDLGRALEALVALMNSNNPQPPIFI